MENINMYFGDGVLDHIAGALDWVEVGGKHFEGFLDLFKLHKWIM